MSLMSAFYVANSGMSTSQNALNTVSHNLTNVNTKGYTRQQVLQGTAGYNKISRNAEMVADRQIGLGVIYSATRQVRNDFLDANYRRESGRSAFYETSYSAITEVELLLQEFDGANFSKALDNLWVAAEELYKEPDGSVQQNLLVQRAAQFVECAASLYEGLCEYQDNLNLKIQQKVGEVNDYANLIYELNHRIVKYEASGLEHANDLRDQRNYALDQLGKLGNIEYSEDEYGNVTVKFEGNVLVNETYVDEMGLIQDGTTGFFTPYWTREAEYERDPLTGEKILISVDGALVYNPDQEIQTSTNTDIGEIKSLIMARGDRRANYTDIDGKYERDISQSVVMNIQAEYDQLIHNVVTAINKVFQDAAEAATAKDPDSTYLRGEDGKPYEIFERVATYSYDANGKYQEEDPQKRDTLYSCFNIQINQELIQSPTKLGLVKEDGSADFDFARALLNTFEYDKYTLNVTVQTSGNFAKYYENLISQVSNSGSVFKGVMENQQETVEAIDSSREQIMGVSSDEELSNMIRFQNAYNANSRFFNVVNEMLAHLLNSLA